MILPKNILNIVGSSGSGKTTLIETLIKHWKQKGLKINVVKQTHHNIDLEQPHKDSARFRLQGATEVVLFGPKRWQLIHEYHNDVQSDLMDVLCRLSPADITLIEGFKSSGLPKIEVYRPENNNSLMCINNPYLIAIASPSKLDNISSHIHQLNLNKIDEIMTFIQDYFDIVA